jgi:hypothetical protein
MRLENQNRFAIGIMAAFQFSDAAAVPLLPEAQLWTMAAKALAPGECLDAGFAKPAAEFLVYGSAWAPLAKPVEDLLVTVLLGALRKSLYVSGDRYFKMLGLVSRPQPFVAMPIHQPTAFGGHGFAQNPAGKGFNLLEGAGGASGFPLPNVEHPGRLMVGQGETQLPAGFWAYSPELPQRAQHLGKFDPSWLANTWPHLPRDTDKKYFHVAPEDQRMAGFLRGDETIQIDNMHPQRAHISAALPGLRARCFVNRRVNGTEQFCELQAHAETVWLFPELECGIVLYRATTDVVDEDADDILHIMAEWEPMAQPPRDASHYEQQFKGNVPASADAANSQTTQMAPPAAAPADVASSATPTPAVSPTVTATAPEASLPDSAKTSLELQDLERLSADFDKHFQAVMRENNLTEEDLAPYLRDDFGQEPLAPHSFTTIEALEAELEQKMREIMHSHGLTDEDLEAVMSTPDPESSTGPLDAKGALLEFNTHLKAIMESAGLTQEHVDALAVDAPELAEMLAQGAVPEVADSESIVFSPKSAAP